MFASVLFGCATVDQSVGPMRQSEFVQGAAIGFGGSEGYFSKAYRTVVSRASDAEVRSMMADDHPPVRLMGFVVALHRWPEQRSALLARAKGDVGEVRLVTGCDLLGEKMTVARLIDLEEAARAQKMSVLLARI